MWNLKVRGLIPHGDSEFFLCPMLVIRQKYLFYFFTKLKTYHLSLFHKNGAIDFPDPSSMQDACHNFVMGFAHHLCVA